jgi:hypothetical protein
LSLSPGEGAKTSGMPLLRNGGRQNGHRMSPGARFSLKLFFFLKPSFGCNNEFAQQAALGIETGSAAIHWPE